MSRYLDLKRLAVGGVVLAAILAPALLLLSREDGGGLAAARLLETPGAGGALRAGLDNGNLAPDFELPNADGGRVRLSDLRGRAVLVNFWATWCGSCLSEMPEIAALQQEKGEAAFTVLAINAGENLAAARRFIDFLKAPFIYGLDSDLVIADAYGVYGLPLSVFIDAGGIVRGVYRGHADRALLTSLTESAIAARTAAEPAPVIRIVSTIYRERVLDVARSGEGRLTVRGRSLRCDANYCAETWLGGIAALAGVRRVTLPPRGASEPELAIEYDGRSVTADALVAAVVAALEASADPLYRQAIEVRYVE